MPDVIMYDETNAWSPELVRTGRDVVGCGGWEVYQTQIASWLGSRVHGLEVHNAGGTWSVEGDGSWVRCHPSYSCFTLITGRHSALPEIDRYKTITSVVDDPRYEKSHDHLRGRSTLVCISDWQASLFRAMGHETVTIHSVLNDEYYGYPDVGRSGFVCVNAWNKGTDLTLHMWQSLQRRYPRWDSQLSVGSPYSEPPDAAQRCQSAGVQWLGRLSPRMVVETLRRSEAVFRVCVAPETFGVTDAIAEAVGTRVHCLCVNGLGAAPEALVSPYLTDKPDMFEAGVLLPLATYPKPKDWRMSTVMPKWLEVLGLN